MTQQEAWLNTDEQLLWGWGRTAPTHATVVHPYSTEQQQQAVKQVDSRGIVARGLGRGYGDCALNAGGFVLDGRGQAGVTAADLDSGVVTALAGTSLEELMEWFVPQGWFVPVTPGTRSVTVGGAIAADIHGKNHHRAGSFGNHVTSIDLIDGTGALRTLTPLDTPDEFWATVGGVGLTGIIVAATIQMTKIDSAYLMVDTDRTNNLAEVMDLMLTGDDDYDYSVAWIDLIATGKSMGRSILERGRFATADEATEAGKSPFKYSTPPSIAPPDIFPSGLLNKLTIRAFNELWYRKSPRQSRDHLASIPGFFHPLDMLAEWNRMYGQRGFIQWQTVIPDAATDLLPYSVERLSAHGAASFLAVLKRMGPQNQGHLSFPLTGWTLALDIPVTTGLARLLDELDQIIADAGGRVYLAKDSRVRPELIPTMYPRLDEWRKIRATLDPEGRFVSDLARRLSLT